MKLVRVSEVRNGHKIDVANLKGKEHFRDPDIDINENWIQLAHERVKWTASANPIISILVR
jgi:hypothetical protein